MKGLLGAGFSGRPVLGRELIRDGRLSAGVLRLAAFALLTLAAVPGWASRVLKDETGRTVTVPDHPHRIICLVPNITDDVFSIGGGDDVVGITDYVKYPAAATEKPSVGSITDPSMETILALHPDLVLGTPHANSQATLDELQKLGIATYLVDPHGMDGILRSILSVGEALNRQAQAVAEVKQLVRRIAAVKASVAGKTVVRVFMPVSYEPVFTIGKGAFITELIEDAGGQSVTADLPREWPQVSLEVVVERAPDALLMLRGGTITVDVLKDRPGWQTLKAVRERRVYLVDKRVDFPSPVAIDALEDLARQFHP